MIVPPTAVKSPYYGNRTLQALWRLAGQALSKAEDLVIMGFSLPPTDLLVSSMLTTTLPQDSLITPVNRSGDVVKRIRATFNIEADDNSLSSWVHTYANIGDTTT